MEEAKMNIERQLLDFPLCLGEEFSKAKGPVSRALTDEQLQAWAQDGLEIARQTARSWEPASEYYRVSPQMVSNVPASQLPKWAKAGAELGKESPALAMSFFKASPGAILQIEPNRLEAWARMGLDLYKGTWKSSTLSCRFFDVSAGLLQILTFQELGQFVFLLEKLSRHSYDMAGECLDLGAKAFSSLGYAKGSFISLASDLVDVNWRDAKALFEAAAKSVPKLERGQRARFINLAVSLLKQGDIRVSSFIRDGGEALSQMDPVHHSVVLTLSESLLPKAPGAVSDFIKSAPVVLNRVTISQLEEWFKEGLKVLEENIEGGLSYFRIESSHSEKTLESLSSVLYLEKVKGVVLMYSRALAGSEVEIGTAQALVDRHIGWVSAEKPTIEGKTVYLPLLVDRYDNKSENFSWTKVVATHQVAHLEFDSFGFDFETPSTLFEDLRFDLAARREASSGATDGGHNGKGSLERGWITDMQRLFNLFDDRKLALDVFTIVEDGRLDARVKNEYKGIRQAYQKIQKESLKERPEIESLPAREALVEFLVRLSLQQYKGIPAPKSLLDKAKTLAAIARRVIVSTATVEDSAEATLRIYAILSQVPNKENPEEEWEDLDLDQDQEYADPEDMDQLMDQMSGSKPQESQQQPSEQSEEEEEEYHSPQDVDYRGDFKPELVQLLSALKMKQDGKDNDSQSLSKEMLEEMLKKSAELDMNAEDGEADSSVSMFADNLVKEAGLNANKTPENGQGPYMHFGEDGGPLETSEPLSYLYDEWDFRADDYKPRWCIVRQKIMAEGEMTFYTETMRNYSSMVNEIKRQFEMVMPEMFRKVHRLPDGEEYDLDAVIEAKVDAKTGNSPSEKLYWKRNKLQRDVAVLFLLDLSASTAEAIEDSRSLPDEWDAPDDPAEYMAWLRNRRNQGQKRTHKRIVDVEKESAVLLISALETIGDTYGIYGFSGYGRENVEFYVIKDLAEKFSDKIKRRIDRVAPLHATRMGPAIRHAISKLEDQPAKTKILFLISDGRPQDRGYSREGVEKEYAVHDTRMALMEAKRKEITPFCLTVDKSGHDYLKTMCQDMGYEVLADIYALPKRLPYLYRKLTI